MLDCAEGTVKSRCSRGRAKLGRAARSTCTDPAGDAPHGNPPPDGPVQPTDASRAARPRPEPIQPARTCPPDPTDRRGGDPMTDSPDLTPEQDAVRRLLADARHDGPTPPEVVARLDEVLAGLPGDEPGARRRRAGHRPGRAPAPASTPRHVLAGAGGGDRRPAVAGVAIGQVAPRRRRRRQPSARRARQQRRPTRTAELGRRPTERPADRAPRSAPMAAEPVDVRSSLQTAPRRRPRLGREATVRRRDRSTTRRPRPERRAARLAAVHSSGPVTLVRRASTAARPCSRSRSTAGRARCSSQRRRCSSRAITLPAPPDRRTPRAAP